MRAREEGFGWVRQSEAPTNTPSYSSTVRTQSALKRTLDAEQRELAILKAAETEARDLKSDIDRYARPAASPRCLAPLPCGARFVRDFSS